MTHAATVEPGIDGPSLLGSSDPRGEGGPQLDPGEQGDEKHYETN